MGWTCFEKRKLVTKSHRSKSKRGRKRIGILSDLIEKKISIPQKKSTRLESVEKLEL